MIKQFAEVRFFKLTPLAPAKCIGLNFIFLFLFLSRKKEN